MSTVNPFPTSEYISPEYFCDREVETQTIFNAIDNQRNITLISSRRMGKTALIKHCFYLLKSRKDLSVHYFDIYSTQNLQGFINLLASSLIGYFESKPEKIYKNIINLLGHFRPKLTFDDLSGAPSVELTLDSQTEAEQSLKVIFEYLAQQKKRIVIAIDEFQQITNYPETNVEALLRTHLQSANNISMIFSGSNRRMMISVFSDYARPFYQSSGFLFLEKIDTEKYASFIKRHFEKSGMEIADDALDFLLKWTKTHTYYVQETCNRLYSKKYSAITTENVKQIMLQILEERSHLYQMYQQTLSSVQFKLLKAIAIENGVEKPQSSLFLKNHNLGAASSVARALEALENKELVIQENGHFTLTDVFLLRWFQWVG